MSVSRLDESKDWNKEKLEFTTVHTVIIDIILLQKIFQIKENNNLKNQNQ